MALPAQVELFLEHGDRIAQQMTVFKFAPLEEKLASLAEDVALPEDQLKYVLSLFAVYPLAMIFARLPAGSVKHLFSLASGIFIAQLVLGPGWIHAFVSSTITWLLMKLWPSGSQHYVVFAFCMGYMTLSHLYRTYTDYLGWTLDFTGPQMILTLKLTSCAFNLYDGTVDAQQLAMHAAKDKVARARLSFAIDRVPSLLEWYGYVFCFTSFLAGPAFEIREYLDSVNLTKFECGKMPGNTLAGLGKLLQGVVCMALFVVGTAQFPMFDVYKPVVLETPFLHRVAYAWVALFFVRQKYYFAWRVAEGATVLAGFGFQGDGKWDGVTNIDITGFELAQSVRAGSRAWNQGTQNWLERYVYLRTGNSLLATYFISAFWHGFYPGYYIFFLSIPLATSANRVLYKRVRPYFLEADGSSGAKKMFYDAVCIFFTSLCLNYMAAAFQVLAWEYGITVWKSYFFSGHIALIVVYLVASMVPTRRFADAKSSKKDK